MSLLEDEKKQEERERTVANERAKMTATYANSLAVALVAVGTLSPAISAQPATARGVVIQGIVGVICLVASAILHWQARRTLGGLR